MIVQFAASWLNMQKMPDVFSMWLFHPPVSFFACRSADDSSEWLRKKKKD
jgi:hypothetical protein